jgi:hypothetical protein
MAVEVRSEGKKGGHERTLERAPRKGKGVPPLSFWVAHVNLQHFRMFLVTGFEHIAPSIPVLSIPLRIRLGSERLSKGLERAESFIERCPKGVHVKGTAHGAVVSVVVCDLSCLLCVSSYYIDERIICDQPGRED